MKLFKWRPKFIRRRDELIIKQDILIKTLDEMVKGLDDTLANVKTVWDKNYIEVMNNKIGKGRMLTFFDDYLKKTIPEKPIVKKAEK